MEQIQNRRESVVGTFVLHQKEEQDVKKLTLFTLFIVLFLGTRCQALENAKAMFLGKHVCVSAGLHASRCKIKTGDTLSEDALAVYGNWRLYSAIKDANPQIVDANKIYAGAWIVLPEAVSVASSSIVSITTPRVQSRTTGNTLTALSASLKARLMNASMELAVNDATETVPNVIPEETIATTISLQSYPLPPAVDPPPTHLVPASLSTNKKSGITGYQMVLPHSNVYRMDGVPLIPMGLTLPTQIGIFNRVDDPANGIAPAEVLNTTSRVIVKKDNDRTVILVVAFPRKLPAQPFVVHIDGMGSIDGKTFASRAEPFYGHFPGKRHAIGTIFLGGTFVANGFLFTELSGNPMIGFGTAGATWGAQWTIHHLRMAALHRAERRYQKRRSELLLAERQKEELGHAE